MRCDVYGWQRCSLLANSLFRYFISIGIIATVRIFSLDVWLIELILVHKHVWSEDLLRLWISDWEFKHCRLVRRTSVGFIIQTCIWFFIEALTVLAPATCIRLFSASWHGFAISRFGRTIICISFILLGLLLLAFIDQLFWALSRRSSCLSENSDNNSDCWSAPALFPEGFFVLLNLARRFWNHMQILSVLILSTSDSRSTTFTSG